MRKRSIIFFLLIIVLIIALVACTNDEKEPTPEPTVQVTVKITPEPTATPTPKPTLEPLSEEKRGIPQADAEVLFHDDFSEDSYDNYLTSQGTNMTWSEEGYLDLTKLDWSAFTPDIEYYLGGDYNQYQLEVSFYNTGEKADSPPWESLFIACRGPEGMNPPIATNDGYFWVAFNNKNKVAVYPGGGADSYPGGSTWEHKYFTITVPETFTETHTVTVVDSGDTICYYMNTADEDYYLILRAEFDEGDLVIYGNNGDEIWREMCVIEEDGAFMFFCHYGRTIVEEISIKGTK